MFQDLSDIISNPLASELYFFNAKERKGKRRGTQSFFKLFYTIPTLRILVKDGKTKFKNASNGDSVRLGRELEIADLLRFIKQKNIRNKVWLTADVHYAAAHYYDPNKAQFNEFTPFCS